MTAGAILSLLLCAAVLALVTRHVTPGPATRRWAVAGAVAAVTVAAGAAGGWHLVTGYKPDEAMIPVAAWVDHLVDWLVVNFGDALSDFNNWIVYRIGFFERFLYQSVAWPLMTLLFAGVAYHASRRVGLALAVVVAFVLIWAMDLWKPTMQTLSLMSVAILVTVVVGLPLGILMSQSDRVRAVMRPLLDLMQTMPSFVYLIPAVMLFGLGNFSGVLATTIYAAPPLIRLTDLGIRLVDREVLEAASAFGASRRQKLFGAQIPLALPNIMAGINQSIMMALAMVVIASMIGVRGLGQEVLYGLQRQEPGTGFVAGLSIVLLAIVLDRITQAYGRRLDAHRHVAR
jgi:ABC-type proline/glycine betaine transport system permease subunit